ncbi:MAG TPA: redoxin domain-containing protein [Thermoanaerobaculia bacterium]|nr:redoxin domain-containing protein [Thermoanaerobaculia bacterium]
MTRDRQRRIGFAVGLLALSFLAFADPPPAPPIWEEKLDEAQDLFEEGKHNDAVKVFKEADKLAKGACLECRIGLARTFNKLGAHKEVLKNVDAALKMTSDKGQLARLYNEQGIALMAMADKDQKQLEQAEKAFRQVLELTEGASNVARFNLGYTLLRLSKDAEGVALLKEYLAKDPAAESAEEAKYLIENPVRARKRLIPDFQLVTLEGEYLTSEDLRGKVVLLDFWGTWCAPCVAALPNLRILSKSMADDPFVLVSISSDSDQAMLREFVAKNKMTWPQVWDEQQVLIRKLQIHSYPTYVLIDPAGSIIHAARGAGGGVEEQLRQKIHAAVRAARKSAKKEG